jgi:hypothetical protein
MALDDDIRRAVQGAGSVSAQVRRLIGRLLGRHREAQRLFLGEDGTLKPEAVVWFARLARENHVNGTTWSGDRDAMLIAEGRRMLALDIIGSVDLDQHRLDQLVRQEREQGHE